MRVKELADLAQTTVRTVHYYHHVGLLPVPPARAGVREYDVYHLARLLRIRWLAESGLPLAAIREVISEPGSPTPDNAAGEINRALTSVDDRIARLRLQREQLVGLREAAEQGRRLTPLSERLAALYDRVAAMMPNEAARKAVDAERSVMVFLAVHGSLPSSLDDLVAELAADDDDDTIVLFDGFAALATASEAEAGPVLDRLLGVTASMLERHIPAVISLLADLPSGLAGVALWATVRRLARLSFPAPAQQRFIELFTEQVTTDPRITAAFEHTPEGSR